VSRSGNNNSQISNRSATLSRNDGLNWVKHNFLKQIDKEDAGLYADKQRRDAIHG
jgi:hypothetical protein